MTNYNAILKAVADQNYVNFKEQVYNIMNKKAEAQYELEKTFTANAMIHGIQKESKEPTSEGSTWESEIESMEPGEKAFLEMHSKYEIHDPLNGTVTAAKFPQKSEVGKK